MKNSNPVSSFVGAKLKPRLKEHLAGVKQDDVAVVNNASPASVDLKAAYRVVGQPVSKG